jgi:hypothetical protein
LSGKNDQNALWQKLNSHNPKFRVVVVLKQPERVLANDEMPQSEFRVVAVEECHAQHTKTLNTRKKGPQRVLAILHCQNASWSFPFKATTRCDVR